MRILPDAMRLLLGPARSLLEEYFESEPLRATLATDAVIGAHASPSMPGTRLRTLSPRHGFHHW